MKVTYFNIQKFCIYDGPGIRTTVFLKGCPLACVWCHNPESQRGSPELFFTQQSCSGCHRCLGLCGARGLSEKGKLLFSRERCTACGKCVEICPGHANSVWGRQDDVDDILNRVAADLPFYQESGGGLTISGGEPSAQPEETLALLKKAHALGIHCAVETCGFGREDFFCRAAKLNPLFLYDIKGIEEEKHRKNTGVGTRLIHRNLDMLLELGARVILRMPLVPGHNDGGRDLWLLREFIKKRRYKIEYAEIMPYHSLGTGKRRKLGLGDGPAIPEGKTFVPKWREILKESGAEIRVSGS